MKIAVYCSSRQDLPDEYTSVAHAVGRWIGEGGHSLVYGGVNAGMMHTVLKLPTMPAHTSPALYPRALPIAPTHL